MSRVVCGCRVWVWVPRGRAVWVWALEPRAGHVHACNTRAGPIMVFSKRFHSGRMYISWTPEPSQPIPKPIPTLAVRVLAWQARSSLGAAAAIGLGLIE